MPQPVALQLLFDLKFIGAATGGQLDEKYAALEAQIEQMVVYKNYFKISKMFI